jgi:ABC-type transporter Mla subunit MlaD
MVDRLALTHLTFVGAAVESASVEFGPAATVIRGPSDTGKSFVVGAIDYMLGGSTTPSDIPERVGYSTALLGLRLPSGETVTLARSVNGGDFSVYEGDVRTLPAAPAPRTLKAKHTTGRDDSLSAFLLTKIGLNDKKIRRNVYNEMNSLSFRGLAHLCVVDETSMQAERPPVLTAITTSKTSDISTLKLMLEGQDDSSLVAVPKPKDRKQAATVREGVFDRLIADLEQQLEGVAEPAELHAQNGRLGKSIATYTESIGRISAERADLSTRIANTDRQAAGLRERLADISALKARFELLGQQYASDLARLDMIFEAGNLLGYFNPGQCVFCGADVEHQHYNDDCADDTTAFRDSVLAEQAKTIALNADLTATLRDLATEYAALCDRLQNIADAIERARRQLASYDEALAPDQGTLKELLDTRSAVEKNLGLYAQIDRLREVKQQLVEESDQEIATAADGMQLKTVMDFSGAIAARLDAWGVPFADQARYDRNDQDIVSGDQLRSAHGKGVRAILHAAFTLGLAQYCYDRELPHPGFVVLDSPLVTYRPPDQGGDADGTMPPSVIEQFYSDIQHGVDGQVIILENTEPPAGLDPECADIVFTKNRSFGRYGFFPLRNKQAAIASTATSLRD